MWRNGQTSSERNRDLRRLPSRLRKGVGFVSAIARRDARAFAVARLRHPSSLKIREAAARDHRFGRVRPEQSLRKSM